MVRNTEQSLRPSMFPGSSVHLKLSEKDRQFEFYLKSAQRAIDIMRSQQQKVQPVITSNFQSLPHSQTATGFFPPNDTLFAPPSRGAEKLSQSMVGIGNARSGQRGATAPDPRNNRSVSGGGNPRRNINKRAG